MVGTRISHKGGESYGVDVQGFAPALAMATATQALCDVRPHPHALHRIALQRHHRNCPSGIVEKCILQHR